MSSSPNKPPPSKPPRLRKTVSVPYETSDSSSTTPQQQQVARLNLISALKRAGAQAQCQPQSHLSQPEPHVQQYESESQPFQSESQLSQSSSDSHSSSTANVTIDSSGMTMEQLPPVNNNNDILPDNERDIILPSSEPKKIPLLPPTISTNIPAKPKPPPSSHKPTQKTVDSESSDDDTFILHDSTAAKVSPSNTKKPLLPPNKPRAISSPATVTKHTPSPPQKRLHRSESSDESPPNRFKPLQMPRTKSHDEHVIAPEEFVKVPIDISGCDNNQEDDGVGRRNSNTIETNMIPISPSSTSSGIPEDSVIENPSPNFSESRDTTPSCIVTNERGDPVMGSPSPNDDVKEDTDGGAVSRPIPQKEQLKKPRHVNQPKIIRKNDTSWIKRKTDESSPPTSPSILPAPPPSILPAPPPQSTSKSLSKKSSSSPYRSIAILPDKPQSFSSSDLLLDTSKPKIGPSGQYYPPAVRLKTPEPQEQNRTSDLALRKTQSNERIFTVQKEKTDDEEFKKKNDVPSRFKKTRRSSSFSGDKKNHVRPVSMMSDVVSLL